MSSLSALGYLTLGIVIKLEVRLILTLLELASLISAQIGHISM